MDGVMDLIGLMNPGKKLRKKGSDPFFGGVWQALI